MDKMQKWRNRFDSFVEEQNLPTIWSDGLFGFDPQRAVEKRAAAWLEFCKVMHQGQIEPDVSYLNWALRKSCGFPTKQLFSAPTCKLHSTPSATNLKSDCAMRAEIARRAKRNRTRRQ